MTHDVGDMQAARRGQPQDRAFSSPKMTRESVNLSMILSLLMSRH